MNQISELDLQNLRHLIGGFDTTHCKMEEYASKATDAQVKQFFQKSALISSNILFSYNSLTPHFSVPHPWESS